MAFTCFRHEQFIVFNVILPSFFCHTSLLLPSSSSAHTSAASSDHSLRLWDVHTHTAIACLTGTTSPLTSVHFSPSSAVVAAACADGSVRLWSTSSGAAVAALAGHTSAAACCMAWSSDEALVAAAEMLAGDPFLRAQLGRAARLAVEQHSWERVIADFERDLLQAAALAPAGGGVT